MIGNVFYNMLTMIGKSNQDPKFIEMGQQVKHML